LSGKNSPASDGRFACDEDVSFGLGVRLDCGQVRASFCRLAHFHFDFSQRKTSIEFNYAITQLSRLSDDGTAGESTAVVGTAVENNAAYFINNGSNYTTLTAENGAQSSSSALVLETIGGHFCGTCKIDVSGNLTCSGKVAGVVGIDGGVRKVVLYSVQSPENWFEDFGSGSLTNGAVTIKLDPTFAQTVNTGTEYHVFLTPNQSISDMEELKALQSECFTMAQLMADARRSIVNLAKTWLEADLARRQEIQTALFPDGLVFSPDFLFFEPRNHTLMQSVSELVTVLINDGRAERI
jgi:hypothetical protein